MNPIKIFISSVQVEFAAQRKALYEYLLSDALLGKFFAPFLFELLPSMDQRADQVYLREVDQCDIYLGLLGKDYGFENKEGVSPTEREFDRATKQHKTRLIFISNHTNKERHSKQAAFVSKAGEALVRRRFASIDELRAAVYAALVRYLEEKEIIRTTPFDASFAPKVDIHALDNDRIKKFVGLARSKRGFPLTESAPIAEVLTHLNLMDEGKITNAAILLFGKQPQKLFINSEIRCAHFHGTEVAKPIPSYQVYKGDVFQLVDHAVDFILSKIAFAVGTRKKEVQISGGYEIPKEIVAEAIVNAIAHRDYTSNGSVQVMLFSDRLEIWNPGSLPLGWTTDKLKRVHPSIPANPLLAEPMYLAGYIERLGTGTADMVNVANQVGLKEPDFVQEDTFKAIIYRPSTDQVPTKHRPSTDQAPHKYNNTSVEVKNLLMIMDGEMNRKEIQQELGLKHGGNFRNIYLIPALEQELIEMTHPENPNHPKQKYRLTKKGVKIKEKSK